MQIARSLFIVLALCMLTIGPGTAQTQSASPTITLDPKATVGQLRRLIAEEYVVAEMRPKIDEALARGLVSGRYQVTDANLLAKRLTEDMAAVAHDKHLGVEFDPAKAATLPVARPTVRPASQPRQVPREVLERARRLNHGIEQLQVLPGNIRYMNLREFLWAGSESRAAIDTAMRFLGDGDAVVIDLRQNTGGSASFVQYLISYFLEPEKLLVTTFVGNDSLPRSSLASLGSERLIGKPLYVLTSKASASAAEEFVGHVAGFKLGEVIGQPTAGAGFHNLFRPLPGGLVVSISFARAVLASTGRDWEGGGITPDFAVAPDKALAVARAHALERLLKSASPAAKPALTAAARLAEAEARPVNPGRPLSAYVGRYDGRSVRIGPSGLLYERADSATFDLVAIGPDEFVLATQPHIRIRFRFKGKAVASLDILENDDLRAHADRKA